MMKTPATLRICVTQKGIDAIINDGACAIQLPRTPYYTSRLLANDAPRHYDVILFTAGIRGAQIAARYEGVDLGEYFTLRFSREAEAIEPAPRPSDVIVDKQTDYELSLMTNSVVFTTLLVMEKADEMFRMFLAQPDVYKGAIQNDVRLVLGVMSQHRRDMETLYSKDGMRYFTRGFEKFKPYIAADLIRLYFPVKNRVDFYKPAHSDLIASALELNILLSLLEDRINKGIQFGLKMAGRKFSTRNFKRMDTNRTRKAVDTLLNRMAKKYVAPSVVINIDEDEIIHRAIDVIELKLADAQIMCDIFEQLVAEDESAIAS